MRTSVLVAALFLSVLGHGQDKTMSVNNMVVAGDWAYFVAPPRMVTDDLVDHFSIAPGGRYALIWGQQLAGKKFAPLFDAIAGKTKPEMPKPVLRIWDTNRDSLLSIPLDPDKTSPSPQELAWSSQPGVAFQVATGDSVGDGKTMMFFNQLWKLNAADGTFKMVANETDKTGTAGEVYCSPTKPIVVVVRMSSKRAPNQDGVQSTMHVRVYDLNGKETKRLDIDQEGYTVLDNLWLKDGTHLVGANYKRGPGPDERKKTPVVFDCLTGTLTPTRETLTLYQAPTSEPALSTTTGQVVAGKDKTEQKMVGLWLTATKPSEQQSCLIAAEFDGQSELLPDQKSVIYLCRSRLYCCEIAKVDKMLYLQAKAAAERTAALSRVKQIGTAMAIYASDHGDNYPGQDGWQGAIDPYLKNQEMMNGFVYTFKGGSITAIENPSSTELGYVSVPGGRCVVYADTHAKYVKDNP